ncbi:unnamed protein product, partial [Allacma fusca]
MVLFVHENIIHQSMCLSFILGVENILFFLEKAKDLGNSIAK